MSPAPRGYSTVELPPGVNSTVAIALWPHENLTGLKQTARFQGGSLVVSLQLRNVKI